MAIDLSRLLEDAFFDEEVQNGSEAIERMLDAFEDMTSTGARPFEVVAADEPDEQWVRERLVHPLIYFCESEGASLPRCGGVVVALYVGPQLYGISAERVVAWASELLGAPIEQLDQQYGTHEVDTGVR